MNLIALLLGLLAERLLTNLLHMREPRWFDQYFDRGLASLRQARPLPRWLAVGVLFSLPIVPVALVQLAFGDALHGVLYVLFAALVLLFSLGPRDLGEEVEEYCEALTRSDREQARRVARELLEGDAPRDARRRIRAVEDAIFVQANNRLFGVIFWFMLLGPSGAWAFRVADLMRRRAVYEQARSRSEDGTEERYVGAVRALHGVLAWVPARLLALGYAMAGSFEDAVSGLREYYQDCAERFFDVSEDVLACVGRGALRLGAAQDASQGEIAAVRAALRLVIRTLVIWLFVIAVLTLAGWAS